MSGKGTGFITGANAKIKLNSKTLAYCTDVSYNINVATIPIESMGKYEVHSNEPVAYNVDGSFNIIRYTKHAKDEGVANTNANGNSVDPMEVGNHLDPKNLLASSTVDLEIFEMRDGSDEKGIFKVIDVRLTRRGMTLNKRGVYVDAYSFVGILGTDTDEGAVEVANSGFQDLG